MKVITLLCKKMAKVVNTSSTCTWQSLDSATTRPLEWFIGGFMSKAVCLNAVRRWRVNHLHSRKVTCHLKTTLWKWKVLASVFARATRWYSKQPKKMPKQQNLGCLCLGFQCQNTHCERYSTPQHLHQVLVTDWLKLPDQEPGHALNLAMHKGESWIVMVCTTGRWELLMELYHS